MNRRHAGLLTASVTLAFTSASLAQPAAAAPPAAAPTVSASPAAAAPPAPSGTGAEATAATDGDTTPREGSDAAGDDTAAAPAEDLAEGSTPVTPPPLAAPASAALVAPPAPAPAAPPPAAPPPRERRPPLERLGSYQTHTWLGVGARVRFVDHSGLDPFADTDELASLDLALGRTVFARRQLSVAAAFDYVVGGRQADARGGPTQLVGQRLTLAPEVRYHLLPLLFVFARPAFGAERVALFLDDGSSGAEFAKKAWAPAFDLSAGAAIQLLGPVSGDLQRARAWLALDAGYGWTGRIDAELTPSEDSSAPARTEPIDLGSVVLRGPAFQLALRATF